MVCIKDGGSICVVAFTYIIVALSNLVYILLVVKPVLKGENPAREADAAFYIEWIAYECIIFMIMWSHISTMTTDPGYIPINYEYQSSQAPATIKALIEFTNMQNDVKGSSRGLAENENELAQQSEVIEVKRQLDGKSVDDNDEERNSSIRMSDLVDKQIQNNEGRQNRVKTLQQAKHATGMNEKQFQDFQKKLQRRCNKCDCVKPPRAHHCSVCNRCILRMDHHCPWMNNCIGLRNQKSFLLFNFYVLIGSLFTIGSCGNALLNCYAQSGDDTCTLFQQWGVLMLTIAAGFLDVMFALFTLCMTCDQTRMICEETSTIDRMQKERQKLQHNHDSGKSYNTSEALKDVDEENKKGENNINSSQHLKPGTPKPGQKRQQSQEVQKEQPQQRKRNNEVGCFGSMAQKCGNLCGVCGGPYCLCPVYCQKGNQVPSVEQEILNNY